MMDITNNEYDGEQWHMNTYETFARVYDTFMDNVPYKEWSVFLLELLIKENIHDGLVLDLGCGTGTMTELLAKHGYDMIGVDNSLDMLEIAQEKRERSGYDILYLLQDMREFELYGTVRAIVCSCDSINYILEEAEVLEVFSLVNNYLDPRGLFVFDFKTSYYYREVLGDQTIAENREDRSFIWDCSYDEDEGISDSELTIFIKQEGTELFERFEEEHSQKGFELEQIKEYLTRSGLQFEQAFDGYTNNEAHELSERIVIVATEATK